MSQRWHYQLFGEQFGPVSEPELRQLLAAGTLAPDDLVRLDKFKDWLPASEALQLESSSEQSDEHAVEVAAEIADLSELAFQFDDSGSTTQRAVYGRAKSPEPANPNLAGAAASSFGGAEDDEELVEPEDGPQWFYQSLGQEFGPVSLAELLSLAAEGELSNSDLVRDAVDGEWRPAGSVSGISAALSLAQPLDVSQSGRTAASIKRFGDSSPGSTSAEGHATANDSHKATTAEETRKSDASNGTAQPATRSRADSSPGSGRKSKKRSGKSREDAVLNEIFDEVFTEEPVAPRRPAVVAPATSAGTDQGPETAAAASLAAIQPAVSQTATQEAAARAASAMNSSLAASRSDSLSPGPSPRRSSGMSIPMPDPRILAAVLLIGGLSWAVWHFGLMNSLRSYPVSDMPGRLQQVVTDCKAMGATPSEADWNRFAKGYRNELMGYFESLMASSSTDAKSKGLILATKQAMSLVAGEANQPDYIKKQLEKLEKLLADVPK
jgi:hypothetical protein